MNDDLPDFSGKLVVVSFTGGANATGCWRDFKGSFGDRSRLAFLGPPRYTTNDGDNAAVAGSLFIWEFAVKYTVLIQESDDGFAASVPGLPGCHSQGETEAEAVANIRDAIREYLDVVKELAASAGTKQVAVEV